MKQSSITSFYNTPHDCSPPTHDCDPPTHPHDCPPTHPHDCDPPTHPHDCYSTNQDKPKGALQKRTFGAHLSRSPCYFAAAERAVRLRFDCFQIFFDSGIKSRYFNHSDAIKTKNFIQSNNIKLFIHSPYTINLCKPTTYAIDMLVKNLLQSNIIGAIGCVVHVGKLNSKNGKIDESVGFRNFLKNVSTAVKRMIQKYPKSDVKLLIETAAGQGSEYPTTIQGLSQIYNGLSDDIKKYVGFCVDTCHIFAAGVCDFRDTNLIDKFIEKWEKEIGWKNVHLVHFNDSKCEFNSKKDRHQCMGKGFIGYDSLLYFQIFCVKKCIPMVLEYNYKNHPDF